MAASPATLSELDSPQRPRGAGTLAQSIDVDQLVREATGLDMPAANTVPPPWKTYDITDAYAERSPVTWVVKDLFSLPSVNMVYGLYGCQKSLLLADLTACVVTNKPWLPMADGAAGISRETHQYRALWIDCDNGLHRTLDRMAAFGRAYGITPQHGLSLISMPEPALDLTTDAGKDLLQKHLTYYQAKVIVLDNLRAFTGTADENSSTMEAVIKRLRYLAEEYGVCFIVVHHSGKSGNGPRGSTSIPSAVDVALEVVKNKETGELYVRAEKERDNPIDGFACAFEYEHQPNTTQLLRARFVGVRKSATIADEDKLTHAVQTYLTAHASSGNGCSQDNLASAVAKITGVSKNTVISHLKRMASDRSVNYYKPEGAKWPRYFPRNGGEYQQKGS